MKDSDVQTLVDAAMADDQLTAQQLNIMLINAEESDALHREHFEVKGATDVMSFPDGAIDQESGLTHLGDLAVCVDVAKKIAAKRQVPCTEEVLLYIIHGVLHLIGYDDQTEEDRQEMWNLQKKYLQHIDITMPDRPEDY